MVNSTVLSIDPNFLLLDTYSVSDESLISNQDVVSTFNPETDYIEYFVYGLNNSLLFPPADEGIIPYTLYSLLDNDIYIDPSKDLQTFGFDQGGYNVLYNFYSNRLASSFTKKYFISEISSDRTEIRLDSNDIEDASIISSVNQFIAERNADNYYPDFLLNFDNNKVVIANNIALDGATVLIKLYEPLPTQFNVKSTLWVVEEVANPVAYNVTFEDEIYSPTDNSIQLKGPNLNLNIKDQINNSTEAISFDNLNASPLTGSYQQLQSLFHENGIQINVDYTEYSNFVNFSSIEARLENFEYKLQLIESYQSDANKGANVPGTPSVSSSKGYYENLINEIIQNFDGYEYFLYFDSGSKSWPKANTEPPFQNLATTDATAISWYNEQITSASLYDELNQDNLFYDVPEYLRNDTINQGYIDFVEMIGQHFDNVWIYIKDISNKYNADNRINAGISKDLVAQTLRDFSLKIYQNNFSSHDIFSSFLGLTPSGSLFPFPYMTGSLPTPTGFEYVNRFISSSTDPVPLDDINKRIYKRLYHNLPYLLKSKGTIQGLKTLLNIYGIPDTILQINEFGGKDKANKNDWDHWQHKYNYEFQTGEGGYVETEWEISREWGIDHPQTLQFRFKTPGLGSAERFRSQSLWTLDTDSHIVLEYTGSLNTSGSFGGSIPDPYKEYATLKFIPNFLTNPTLSASIYLPFFDGEWWSVMATFDGQNASLYAADNLYNGVTGTEIGYYGSSSIAGADPSSWNNGVTSYFAYPSIHPKFSGSLQEIRYYNTVISKSRFEDYTMNPHSFEGNSIESGSLNESPDQLVFRATLGGELYTGSNSIHPKVTGSWIHTASFSSGDSNFILYGDGHQFGLNREYIFFDQFPAGIKNRINDKIKSKDLSLPVYNLTRGAIIPNENTLSNQRSIQQDKVEDNQYTNNIDLLEVTFSPQNEINDDIIQQLGYFNIGNIIGDPREKFTQNDRYPELHDLNEEYFLKYVHENYDFNDYVRLIKFFDNSLFKMIKDFIPAKTSLASGVTIKQHILERQKYPEPQADWTRHEYTGSIGQIPALLSGSRIYSSSTEYQSFPLYTFSGGTGGSLDIFNTARGYLSGSIGDPGISTIFVNGPFKNVFELNPVLNSTINIDSQEIFEYNKDTKLFKNISGIPVRFDLDCLFSNFGSMFGYLKVRLADKYGNPISETYTTQELGTAVNSLPGYIYGITIPKNGEFQIQLSETNPVSGITLEYFSFKFNLDSSPIDTAGEIWEEVIATKVGNLTQSFQSEEQLYNGEFKDSLIDVVENDLLDNPYLLPQTQGDLYNVIVINGDTVKDEDIDPGEIYIAVAGGRVYGIGIHPLDVKGGNHIFSLQTLNSITLEFTNGTLSVPYKVKISQRGLTPTNAYFYQFETPGGGSGFIPNFLPLVGTYSNIEIFFDPPSYSNINFYNSDFNPLINDISDNRLSNTRFDVDYSAGGLVAVNYPSIKTQDATKAQLQDYNYSTLSSTRPRYIGSRNSVDLVNYTSSANVINLQNEYKQSYQPSIFKETVVEQLNAASYGINFGGGTSPEILGLGGTSLNSLYIIGNSKDAINIIPPSDPNYSNIINTSVEPGDLVTLYQYKNTEANIPTKLEVVSTNIKVPERSAYMISSEDSTKRATITTNLLLDNGIIFDPAFALQGVFRVNIDPTTGYYTAGDFLGTSNFISEFIDIFNRDSRNWYITLYNTLDSPVVYTGSTATEPYKFVTPYNTIDPLGYYGVARITNVVFGSGGQYGFNIDRDLTSLNNTDLGNNTRGILIWNSQGDSIIVKNNTLSGVGQGLIYSEFSPSTLTENLDYISKTYANNSN